MGMPPGAQRQDSDRRTDRRSRHRVRRPLPARAEHLGQRPLDLIGQIGDGRLGHGALSARPASAGWPTAPQSRHSTSPSRRTRCTLPHTWHRSSSLASRSPPGSPGRSGPAGLRARPAARDSRPGQGLPAVYRTDSRASSLSRFCRRHQKAPRASRAAQRPRASPARRGPSGSRRSLVPAGSG